MAIVQNPITGRTRKKFGTAVFSKHYENNTMRSRPMQVSNPRTEGQVLQRSKFAQTVDLIRPVSYTHLDVYKRQLYCLSCGESEYRQFLSAAADEDVYQGIGNPFAC